MNHDVTPWIETFFWLLGGVAVVLGIVAFFRRSPPIDADLAKLVKKEELEKYARQEALDKTESELKRQLRDLDEKIDDLRESLDAKFDGVRKSDEARASGLHKRTNQILRYSERMNGQLSMLPCLKGRCDFQPIEEE